MTDTGKLSDGEFRVMQRLLQRYAKTMTSTSGSYGGCRPDAAISS